MPVSGPNAPTTLVNDNSYGSVAWTNPSNAAFNDNIVATAALNTSGGNSPSNYLKVTGFQFNIPSNATILGILVQIARYSGAGNIADDRVRLILSNAVQGAIDKASVAFWPLAEATASYGSLTDTWGLSLAPADVNNVGFGVALAAKGLAGSTDVGSVDNIQVTVYYELSTDLINLPRALQNFNFVTASSTYPLIGTLIGAVSDAIKKYCRRDFIARAYDELYNGNGDRRLMLREYPIQAVTSVRYRPVTVLKVINSDQATNQQARAAVTSTGLQCWRMASGVPTTETLLTYAAYPTLNNLASAVTALGNGWSGQLVGDAGGPGLQGDYGLWPSADLYVPPSFGDGTQSQGNLTARGTYAELKMHSYELQGYQFDPRGWLLRAIPYTDPELLHPEDLIWPVGVNNFRVQYTAGYTLVPGAVQEAAASWVAILWFQTQRDPKVQAQTIPGAITQNFGLTDYARPPAPVAALLAPYRRHTIGVGGG